jgi:HSP20 family protein
MPIDAWPDGDRFVVEFDLPGVEINSLDLDIERNVLTVRAQRAPLDQNREMAPRGL